MIVQSRIIQPYVNIPRGEREYNQGYLPENLRQMSVGAGARAIRMDGRGLWIGSETPVGASFYVDINGNATITGVFSFLTDTLDDIVDGVTYSRVLKTDISAGHILLTEAIGSLDSIDDGSTYSRVRTTAISAGNIRLDETVNGTYSKILTTDISAGHIILSSAIGDLDDIDDGTTFKRVTTNEKTGAARGYSGLNSSYQIIKGFVDSLLSSVSLPTNGVRIDVNGIYGRKSGVTTFYVSDAGDAYFAGTVASSVITSPDIDGGTIDGVTITGGTVRTANADERVEMSSSDAGRVKFYYGGSIRGSLKAESTTKFQISTSNGADLEYISDTDEHRFYGNAGGNTAVVRGNVAVFSRVYCDGTAGLGFLSLYKQSSNASSPTTDAVRLFMDGSSNLKFKRADGKIAVIDLSAGTIGTWA